MYNNKLNILNCCSPFDITRINSLKLSVDNYIDLDVYKQKIRSRLNINDVTDPQKYMLIDNYIKLITKSDKINQNLYI